VLRLLEQTGQATLSADNLVKEKSNP
jgi:hypothetical protein